VKQDSEQTKPQHSDKAGTYPGALYFTTVQVVVAVAVVVVVAVVVLLLVVAVVLVVTASVI
jgi:Flp pilus assembly protein TadB